MNLGKIIKYSKYFIIHFIYNEFYNRYKEIAEKSAVMYDSSNISIPWCSSIFL